MLQGDHYSRHYAFKMGNLMNSQGYKNSTEREKKNLIGNEIYEYIEKLVPEVAAPKITGMLLDLPMNDLIYAVTSHEALVDKVEKAR